MSKTAPVKRRLVDRLCVALLVAGLSSGAYADTCIDGTICWPEPSCGPAGGVYCPGDDGSNPPQATPQLPIPHRNENPFQVSCGNSSDDELLRSMAFDVMKFYQDNGYRDYVDADWGPRPLSDFEFWVTFSDGSHARILGGLITPGQWQSSWLQQPLMQWEYLYGTTPVRGIFLGPDASGFGFGGSAYGLEGLPYSSSPISMCERPI